MPQFNYTAVDGQGRRVTQVITATSKIDVANMLKQNNLFVLEIAEIAEHRRKLPKRLSMTDRIFFSQNIATLLSSGMSLSASLAAISEDTENRGIIPLYVAIRHDLERGFPFAKALSRYPEIFDNIYVSLIQAGENSGKLEDVMQQLADRLEKDSRTINQVRSALMYPTLILSSLFVLGGLIITFVLPKLIPVFTDLKVKLPITTRMLIGLSQLITHHTVVFFSSLAVMAVLAVLIYRSRWGKRTIATASVHIPVVSKMINYLDMARIASTMSLLLSAGVPIQKAIEIASGTVKNPKLKIQLETAAKDLATGSTLAQSLSNSTLPKTFVALIGVGERSGNIDKIFGTLADHYEDLLDTSVKSFTGLIEPILTLFVGLIVGGTVLSVMVPIYSVVGNFGK